ncbi:ethanolamine ammonia-lyase reactivating factor EutA [Escherichia coli]|nr:ethanolamine ammonia-lyase reactivating factor EutA [Escherichia coli]
MVYAHKPGQMIVDECFCAGTDARALTGAQLVQVTWRMAALIVEVIDGTLSPLAQALMQTGLLFAGVARPKSLRFLEAWANAIATSPPTRSVLPILAHFWQRRRCMTIRACVR